MNRRSTLEYSPGAAGPGLAREEAAGADWRDLAECQYTDPEIFFPEKGGSVRAAKRVCRSCAVRTECLQYALDTGQGFGVWGGLSEQERHRLPQAAEVIAPRMCQKGLHVMDDGNRAADGRCRACKNAADARSYRKKHPLILGKGNAAEPRARGAGGRFTPRTDKKLAA